MADDRPALPDALTAKAHPSSAFQLAVEGRLVGTNRNAPKPC